MRKFNNRNKGVWRSTKMSWYTTHFLNPIPRSLRNESVNRASEAKQKQSCNEEASEENYT